MNTKRVWMVAFGAVAILAALLGAFGFILPSVQASQEQAAPSVEQPAAQQPAAPVADPVSVPDDAYDYSAGESCGHESADALEQFYLDQ